MQSPVLASVDEHGIKLKAQGFEVADGWEAISKVHETASLFVFFKPGNGFIFIPKREMNDSQFGELRSVITSYARGKIKLAPSFAQL
jgi:hypothetical protein